MLDLNLHAFEHPGLDIVIPDIIMRKGSMTALKIVALQNLPHIDDLVGAQGDHIGDGIHEGERVDAGWALPRLTEGVDVPVCEARGGDHQGVSYEKVVVKEEDQTPREMAAQLYGRCACVDVPDLDGRLSLAEKDLVLVGHGRPLLVFNGEVYRTVEGLGPLHVSGVIVGMRDDDSMETAELVDLGDGGFINQGYAVPEDIPCWSTDEDCSLTDAKLGGRGDGDETGLVSDGLELVLVGDADIGKCGERLTGARGVLSGVVADKACVERGAICGWELGAAGRAHQVVLRVFEVVGRHREV